MTISELALAAKKVIDAAWQHGSSYDLASQAAFALESARLLQLPVPVSTGSEPLALTEAQIDALAEAGNRVVNDMRHEDLCMCDAWPEKCLSSGNFSMGDWDMSGLEAALPAVLALWEQMRGGELTTLRTRVAELEAERNQSRSTAHRLAGDAGLIRREPCSEDVTPQVTKLRTLLAGQRAAVEDPHDSPLHHRYVVSHDLPPVGGQ
jgi:hypothetical protein